MKDIIVIAGNEYLALGIIRSLAIRNYRTKLIAIGRRTYSVAGKSKYVTERVCCQESWKEIYEALNHFKKENEKILVIACRDKICRMIDLHLEELTPFFYIPNIQNTSGNIVRMMDKVIQKEMAAGVGLCVARGCNYRTDKSEEEAIIRQVKYPCFIKALVSAATKQSKIILRKCENAEELISALATARENLCKEVLIEEYLEIDKEICAYGIAGEGNVCIPALVITERSGQGDHEGVAAEGKTVSSEKLGPIKEKLIRLMKEIGLNGLFCIDMIVSHGTVYFSEINLRPGGSVYAVTLSGVSLPAMFADMVYQGIKIGQEEIKKEISFINERVEADLFVDHFVPLREVRKEIRSDREHFVKDQSDPGPWKRFGLFIAASQIKKRIKGNSRGA